jgi:bifunctional non-homologous end joining protein LigD
VLLEREQARVLTRNGHDGSDRYPSIVRAATSLRCRSAIIDGEAIVPDANGASDFEALSSAMRCHPVAVGRVSCMSAMGSMSAPDIRLPPAPQAGSSRKRTLARGSKPARHRLAEHSVEEFGHANLR